jgi:hypothetical protein
MKVLLLSLASMLIFAVNTTAQPICAAPTTGFTPINDLKSGTFNGWTGGLYPNGSNYMPYAHKIAGMNIAATQIIPRDASGNMDIVNGKIVWLSIGMSNTTAETSQFIPMANAYPNKNPKLVFIDGALGGMTASIISTASNSNYSNYWNTVINRLANVGLTANQVQIIWYKEANVANSIPVMNYYDSLVVQTKRIMNIIKQRFPNAIICYMASRISARYASTTLNPEPFAYYTGWAIKKVIEDQIAGDSKLKYSGQDANSPWLSWGIYMWSDGSNPQITNPNVFWTCPTDFQNDGTHPSNPAGAKKVADLLLSFYQNDTISCPWFFNNPPSFCSSIAGINDKPMMEDDVIVFPNPAYNIIQIKTTLPEYTCTLYNPQGQMIYQNQNAKEMNLAELTAGLYFLTIKNIDGQLHGSKFIILKQKNW